MPGRLQGTLLTCPVDIVLYVYRVRSLILRFDLSILPYLLRSFHGSPPSGCPRSVSPSRLRLRQSEKSCKQRFGASPVKDAGQSRKRRWPGLPFGDCIALLAYCLGFFWTAQELRVVRNVAYWAELLLGSRSMRTPGL